VVIQSPHQQDAHTDVADVLPDLRRVFAGGRTRDLQWRLDQLAGIERLCVEAESRIAAALAEDLGRSAVEAWLGDVNATKGEAAYARKHLKKWMRRKRMPLPLNQLPARGWVQYDPLGVVLIIGPWNYPLYLSLGPLVAAVAAGSCAVIKPSELAPATSALLARLVPDTLTLRRSGWSRAMVRPPRICWRRDSTTPCSPVAPRSARRSWPRPRQP
jgi:aldehyde dehydrogenase (NAD+)